MAKATSSTQRPQTCTEAATKYYNYTANKTAEEREHRLLTLQKAMRRGNAWGEATIITHVGGTNGVNTGHGRPWNIGYPALTTATPFKSQKILFNARALASHLPIIEPALKPALHSYAIYSNSLPFHPWHFMGIPLDFTRFCDTRISSVRNDDIFSQRLGLKTAVKNDIFWSEIGSEDLKNQEAHSHQEFPGMPPPGRRYFQIYALHSCMLPAWKEFLPTLRWRHLYPNINASKQFYPPQDFF